VFPVRYELDFYISEDGILHSHRRENLKSYTVKNTFTVLMVDVPIPAPYPITSSVPCFESVGYF
jgi:hypothetical protein